MRGWIRLRQTNPHRGPARTPGEPGPDNDLVVFYQTTVSVDPEHADKVLESIDLEVNPELPQVLMVYAITVE